MSRRSWLSILLSMLILFSSLGVFIIGGLAANNESVTGASSSDSGRSSRLIIIDADPNLATSESYTNELIYLNSNLTIASGGILTLTNTSLIVNESSVSYNYGIYIEDGGSLIVESDSIINRNIYQSNSEYELEFRAGSNGNIKDSTISDCGYTSEKGIYVASSDVTFSNCLLDKNYNGIYCFSASPTINDCSINDSDYAGIICNNSILTLDNCVISESWYWDVVVENGSNLTLLSTDISIAGGTKITDTSNLAFHWWLTVNVTNVTGAPLKNASVEVRDKYGDIIKTGNTDANGQLKNIECVERVENTTSVNTSTPHTITVELEGYKSKEENFIISEDLVAEIELELKPATGDIKGKVKGEDQFPIEGVNVSISYDDIIVWDITNAAGDYELTDIPHGTNYTVTVEGIINNLSVYKTGKNETVVVEPENTTIVDFILVENPLPVEVTVKARDVWINLDGAEDVNIDTDIRLEFESPMDNTTILKGDNVQLQLRDEVIPGTIKALDVDIRKEYLFSPDEPLEKETTYTFLIRDEVRRLVGGAPAPVFWKNYLVEFTTEIEPIIGKSPAENAIDIDPVNPSIYITFHNTIKLNKSSLEHAFKLKGDLAYVDGIITIDEIMNRATFTPAEDLLGATEYTVELWDDLVDAKGNRIFRQEIGLEWKFTTKKTTTEVFGIVVDKDGNPLANARVELLYANDTIAAETFTNSTGHFEITGLEPRSYKIIISIKDHEPYEKNIVPDIDTPVNVGTVELKKEKGKGEELEIDPMMLGIIAIVIIIIIILIIAAAMRKPKPELEEEYMEEEAAPARGIGAGVAPPVTRRMEPQPTYMPRPTPRAFEGEEMALAKPEMPKTKMMRSINRCPICGHKLLATGECFHCKMDQLYGR